MNLDFTRKKWLIFWGLLSFVGLMMAVPQAAARSGSETLAAFADQFFRFQTWAALSVIVIFIDSFFSGRNVRWRYRFPIHVLLGVSWAAASMGAFSLAVASVQYFRSGTLDVASTAAQVAFPMMIMGFLAYKMILTTNYALDYYKRYTDERQRTSELESKLRQAELNALKMQLQPHFLFNTLNAISNFAMEDPKLAVRMIARLGDFLRLTIETQNRQFVSLEDELDFARKYLEIEQLRFSDRLIVNISVASDALSASVPNLILQPFIENAIKYGISKRSEAGRLEILAERRNGVLRMEVANDGPVNLEGINGLDGSGGIGIVNSRNRLSQLYGPDFVLDLDCSNVRKARVLIEIPYSNANG